MERIYHWNMALNISKFEKNNWVFDQIACNYALKPEEESLIERDVERTFTHLEHFREGN